MNEVLLYGWARRIERDAGGAVCAFEVQQTRNLNHAIPARIGGSVPVDLADGAPVYAHGRVEGSAPAESDPYPPPLVFIADTVAAVDDYASMPPDHIFGITPPPEALTDGFEPPASQFGRSEDLSAFNHVVACGYLEFARLTDGVNDYLRRDSMEVMLRVAPPPAHPLQVRLYGRHAQTYSRHAPAGLPLKVTGALRIRTKPDGHGGVRRMLYIHCGHLRVPRQDELPYLADWLVEAPDAVA